MYMVTMVAVVAVTVDCNYDSTVARLNIYVPPVALRHTTSPLVVRVCRLSTATDTPAHHRHCHH
jgi:hypothetical protein